MAYTTTIIEHQNRDGSKVIEWRNGHQSAEVSEETLISLARDLRMSMHPKEAPPNAPETLEEAKKIIFGLACSYEDDAVQSGHYETVQRWAYVPHFLRSSSLEDLMNGDCIELNSNNLRELSRRGFCLVPVEGSVDREVSLYVNES